MTYVNGMGRHRPDFAAIAGWIKLESSVLDLGCGDGTLLRYLKDTRRITGYGVEIDDASVLACVKNGVNVVQSDLERGLSGFEDNSFDYVVLSQTLQAMKNSEVIMREMLRVGREGIVTFPNFGYWKNRLEVLKGGCRFPENLPYEWFDTPNVHLCTVADFERFCDERNIRVVERKVLTRGHPVSTLPNLLGPWRSITSALLHAPNERAAARAAIGMASIVHAAHAHLRVYRVQLRSAALHAALPRPCMAALRGSGSQSDRLVRSATVALHMEIPVVTAGRSLRAACVRP